MSTILEDVLDVPDLLRAIFDIKLVADVFATIMLRLVSKRLSMAMDRVEYNKGQAVPEYKETIDGQKFVYHHSWRRSAAYLMCAVRLNPIPWFMLRNAFWHEHSGVWVDYEYDKKGWMYITSACFKQYTGHSLSIPNHIDPKLMDVIESALQHGRASFIDFLMAPEWGEDSTDMISNVVLLVLEYALRHDDAAFLAKHVQRFRISELKHLVTTAVDKEKTAVLTWFMEHGYRAMNVDRQEMAKMIFEGYMACIRDGTLDVDSDGMFEFISACRSAVKKRKAEEELQREDVTKQARVEK